MLLSTRVQIDPNQDQELQDQQLHNQNQRLRNQKLCDQKPQDQNPQNQEHQNLQNQELRDQNLQNQEPQNLQNQELEAIRAELKQLRTLVQQLVQNRTESVNDNKQAPPPQLLMISGSGFFSSSLRAEGGKMAAAQSDRDQPSALCSEFLNFSAKDTASRWLVASDLQQEVYRHLAVYVPRILCLGPSGCSSREEQREEQREDLACQLLLLAPLEWLLLGEEPAAGLALLQEKNQPSPLCGHVFKVGEPTYSCR
ncbi:general transcriptional corepressor trfA-like [Micropterus salmoides]|uniref:general transcriptional corepressor trfA-like n=1 Tax=Micropterus salmoides TaxID=27706 RepID=UPI0018ED2785|nr:general transcriptional corepressor trfA-like [Micropterus salmoides]